MANCTELLLHFPEREPSKLWPLYYGLFHYFLVEPENMKTNTKVKKLLKYTFTVEERVSFGIAYLFLKRHKSLDHRPTICHRRYYGSWHYR